MKRTWRKRMAVLSVAASLLTSQGSAWTWANDWHPEVEQEDQSEQIEETAEEMMNSEEEESLPTLSEENGDAQPDDTETEEGDPTETEEGERFTEEQDPDWSSFDFVSFDSTEIDDFTAEFPEDLLLASAAAKQFVQEGVPVRTGAGGFRPVQVGADVYRSKYIRLGWNADSQIIPWNNAGSDVLFGTKTSARTGTYFMPLNNNAKGKFGYRVTNVGYDMAKDVKLDLVLTCTNYGDYTYDNKGNKIEEVYPFFGMVDRSEIWVLFDQVLPDMELRIDVVKNGTNTPVKGNYRFRWLDIDGRQRFGFAIQNGSLGGKYATDTSVVNVEQKTLFGRSYEVLTAPDGGKEDDHPDYTVVYEIDQASGIWLSVLKECEDNWTPKSKKTIESRFNTAKSGSLTAAAGLNWDSKGYGPVEYPVLEKSVGNDVHTLEKQNVLGSSTDSFYYTLQTYVPEEHPAYYYKQFRVEDVLPAGVDYNGYAVVTDPVRGDVTGQFQISAKDDHIVIEAPQNVLAGETFYGKTYEFKFGVTMDPTEIAPVFTGDRYRYTVKNKAALACQHIGGQEGRSSSNEVVTICDGSIHRSGNTDLNKTVAGQTGADWKNQMILNSKDAEYRYKLSVNVPGNEYAGWLEEFEVDDVLPAGAAFTGQSIQIYGSDAQRADRNFQVNIKGKQLKIKATDQAMRDTAFYGKQYDMVLPAKMVSSEIKPSYSGNTAVYETVNRFTLKTRHKTDKETTQLQSSPAAVQAKVIRKEPEKPGKWILDGEKKTVEKEYTSREHTIVYDLEQKIPEFEREWGLKSVLFTDTLEECLMFQGAEVYANGTKIAEFDRNGGSRNGWNCKQDGQQLKFELTGTAMGDYYGKTAMVKIRVQIKSEYDLSKYYTASSRPEITEAHIPNTAASELTWQEGSPASIRQNTNQTQIILKEGIPKGSITVKKLSDEEKALQGAVYRITVKKDILSPLGKVLTAAGTVAATITTGNDGRAVAGDLYPGVYSVQEIKPPKGYTLHSGAAEVTVGYSAGKMSASAGECVFHDVKTLVILKKVSEAEAGKQKALEGAEFAVWSKNDTTGTKSRYVTDKDGQIRLSGLFPGTYVYQETKAPAGYARDDKTHEFIINELGQMQGKNGQIITIENSTIKADFAKMDKASGKYVEGARLQLQDAKGTVVDTWVSEKTPHRIKGIAAGTYILTELTPPSGYKKASPVTCVIREQREVQSFEMKDTKYVEITVSKTISGKEIVWAHGNPVFTFFVSGTDLDGEKHSYCDMVEFTRQNASADGNVSQSVTFRLPAGQYSVSEGTTARYEWDGISNIVNGTQSGRTVVFDLSKNQNGSASFRNRKTTDRNLTHTALVRNVIIP